MKIALVHDHLVQDGGAEQVVKALKEMYPEAPIFTLVFKRKVFERHNWTKDVRTSFLQKFPWGVDKYQWLLPLMPAAVESFDLSAYDLVISSASSFAKGVILRPGAVHVCYCHTPTRYLWSDKHNYIQDLNVNALAKKFLPLALQKLRIWDSLAAGRVDHFIANSHNVSRRMAKYYGRGGEIIHPPVACDNFFISNKPKEYFLAGSRLVPYKRLDLAVRAFSRLGIPLKVFGIGPEINKLRAMAKPNVEFLGKVGQTQKAMLFADCKAYINPQDEDFGITAVEAMASGRPVIAYRSGGALESVVEGVTGEFFDEQCWEDLADKVIRFNEAKYDPKAIRARARNFDISVFKRQFADFIDRTVSQGHADSR